MSCVHNVHCSYSSARLSDVEGVFSQNGSSQCVLYVSGAIHSHVQAYVKFIAVTVL